MMTVKREVMPCEERMYCDCGGEMKPTGTGITQMLTTWQHRCAICGIEAWFVSQFPRLAYLPRESAAVQSAETYVLSRGEKIIGAKP